GRGTFEDHLQVLQILTRDPSGVEILAESLGEKKWSVEGTFHGELLIEKHPDQEGQTIIGEQLVGLFRLGEIQVTGTAHISERTSYPDIQTAVFVLPVWGPPEPGRRGGREQSELVYPLQTRVRGTGYGVRCAL